MKYFNLIGSGLLCLALVGCTSNDQTSEKPAPLDTPAETATATETQVIELTQVGCQFLEVEGKDYQYQPANADDCKKINSETLANRETEFKPLELKPGKYIFRVTNANVDYPLGFYLRGEGIKKVSLPKVSGGGLTKGVTKDYEITLTSGKYVFSCPLNPTPDYPVVVN